MSREALWTKRSSTRPAPAARFASAVLALLAVSMLVAGCGAGGTSPNPSPPPAPPPPPPPPGPAPVASVVVALTAPSAIVGQTVQATATTRDAAGNALSGRSVAWSSASPNIASVSATGLVTAKATGSTQITATSEGVIGAQTFTTLVSAESVDSVVLSLDSVEVIVGDTMRLVAVARDAGGNPVPGIELTWSTTDSTVATVSTDGLVTSMDLGEAEIDVTVIGPSASGPPAAAQLARGKGSRSRAKLFSVPKIVVTPGNRTADIGGAVAYAATITNLNNQQLRHAPPTIWRSTSPSVATIDIAGLATAVGKGTTNIVATVTVGAAHSYSSAPVQLKVIACGGLMEVTSWSATVSVAYAVTTDVELNGDSLHYTIDQGSTGTASLRRKSASAGGDSVVWEGVISGTGHVDDKSVQRSGNPMRVIGTSTDVGNGPELPLFAHVRLAADWSVENGCRYSIRYQDEISYHHTDTPPIGNYTIPSTIGVVADKLVSAGAKPSAGWQFDVTKGVPGMLFPAGQDVDDELTSLGATKYYLPFSPIAASLLQLEPNNTFGTATFKYLLVAH